MKKNDINRLKDEADIETVIDYLGIEKTVRGSATFILCPLPSHADTHATNCYFKSSWNHVFCQTCGTTVNAIDLILYTKNLSYGEAADLLWELEGRPSWYYAKRTKKDFKPEFQLSNEESTIIGLKKSGIALCPTGVSSYKEELHTNYEHYPSVEAYIRCKRERVNITEWVDKETFLNLVLAKSKEQYFKLKSQLEFHIQIQKLSSNNPIHFYIINELKNRISVCSDVYHRANEFKKENS